MTPEGQRSLAHQILNEVLNGYRIDYFESEFGISRQEAIGVWERLRQGTPVSDLSARYRSFLRRATVLTVRELEDGVHEFQTRMGFEVNEARDWIELLSSGVSEE
jgi:hypothetical protein